MDPARGDGVVLWMRIWDGVLLWIRIGDGVLLWIRIGDGGALDWVGIGVLWIRIFFTMDLIQIKKIVDPDLDHIYLFMSNMFIFFY